MLNLIGEGIEQGAKKALSKATKEAGEEVAEKAAKKVVGSAADIAKAITSKYGDKAGEIMAYYGGDIGKSARSAKNSFLGRLISGEKVEDPLLMYHSVDSGKLSKMLDLAEETSSDYAIPNPSLQVVNPAANIGGNYGDVILLGNKTIPGGVNKYSGLPDPHSKYRLYSRDIYSPRKPNIVYSKGTPIIEGTKKLATPQNISDYMTKQGTKAVESTFTTPASLAATQSYRFSSPLDAVKNASMLQPLKTISPAFTEWNEEVSEVANKFLDKFMSEHPNENPYIYADYIYSEVQDAMAGKKPWNDPYGINTEEGLKTIQSLNEKAKGLPTAYFEAKPTRAVPLKEFGGAVLPQGYNNQRILKALEDSGIEVKGYYDPADRGESLQNILVGLTKKSDRLNTPYLLGLATLLGGGAMLGYNNKKEEG